LAIKSSTSATASRANVESDLIPQLHWMEIALGRTVKLFTTIACRTTAIRTMVTYSVAKLGYSGWPDGK
jgi:hypothetical protein